MPANPAYNGKEIDERCRKCALRSVTPGDKRAKRCMLLSLRLCVKIYLRSVTAT